MEFWEPFVLGMNTMGFFIGVIINSPLIAIANAAMICFGIMALSL